MLHHQLTELPSKLRILEFQTYTQHFMDLQPHRTLIQRIRLLRQRQHLLRSDQYRARLEHPPRSDRHLQRSVQGLLERMDLALLTSDHILA